MEGLEEDPAAAFLAREQDELAGIADDTLGGFTSASVSFQAFGIYSLRACGQLFCEVQHSLLFRSNLRNLHQQISLEWRTWRR